MRDQLPYLFPFLMNLFRYFLIAGIPFLVFYILFPKAFEKNRIQKRLSRSKDFLREIAFSIQTSFIFAALGVLMLKTPLRSFTKFYVDIEEYSLWWIPVSTFLALVLHDTYFYWMHRWVHQPRIYRKVHLVHHQSVNPSPWTSYSFHFLEGVVEGLIIVFILLLIPMHPIALISFAFLSLIINVYGHLGYEIAPKWFRKSIFFPLVNTSIHHNLHHSTFRGNYGLYFRFWDRIMGTEHPDYEVLFDQMQEKRFNKA